MPSHPQGQGEMCVCDLAAFINISQSAISHQLRLLRQLRIVNKRRAGQVLYYRLSDKERERNKMGKLFHKHSG